MSTENIDITKEEQWIGWPIKELTLFRIATILVEMETIYSWLRSYIKK